MHTLFSIMHASTRHCEDHPEPLMQHGGAHTTVITLFLTTVSLGLSRYLTPYMLLAMVHRANDMYISRAVQQACHHACTRMTKTCHIPS